MLKNFKLNLIFLLIAVFFFSGCIRVFAPGVFGERKPPEIITCNQEPVLKYIIPKDMSPFNYNQNKQFELEFPNLLNKYNCAEGLGNLCSILGIKNEIINENLISVTKYHGLSSRKNNPDNSVTYEINKKVTIDNDKKIIIFTPLKCIKDIQTKELQFSREQLRSYLMRTSKLFPTVSEINSDYPQKSVKANFDRILGEKHILQINDQEVNLDLKLFPYRNGSKAVISYDLPVFCNDQNTVDIEKNAKVVEKKLEKIVNS